MQSWAARPFHGGRATLPPLPRSMRPTAGQDRHVRVGPNAYTSWRGTSLGAITESIEQQVLLDLAGDVCRRLVLDAGCGDGSLACAVASRGAAVTGADPDPAMLAAARERAEREGLAGTFIEGCLEALPF
jgi:2-polyprenyl-3-methyl-5-hydroxy-6-metoxy-1,4-benzoquinol methylase